MASQPTPHNTTVVFPESSASSTSAFIATTVSTKTLNKEIFDIAFTMAIGCTQYKQGGCDEMRLDHRFANAAFLTDHWKYKYLIDVDGMGYSAHFLAFMASESAVMKSTVYREFFSDWIQPWYVILRRALVIIPSLLFSRLHYIPVSQSYAELYNIHAYFSGPSPSTIDATRSVLRNFTAPMPPPDPTSSTTWPHEGDRRLRQIARAGRQWKKTMTRREDMEGTSLVTTAAKAYIPY
jgi:Glycosyl transferase family 90